MIFNNNFYPTSREVYNMMDVDCYGKTVYDPSAGSGNLLKFMAQDGASKILAGEKSDQLVRIINSLDYCQVISRDFLDVVAEQISHIDSIVMNPPFSDQCNHVIHAWEIAPEGCEIITLVNYDSYQNAYGSRSRELQKIVESYGYCEVLGEVFRVAERTTNVNVGLMKLYKPVVSDKKKFDGFYLDCEDTQEYGLINSTELHQIVGWYKGAIENIDEIFTLIKKTRAYSSKFGMDKVGVSMSYNNNASTKEEFAIELQKRAWSKVIEMMNLSKYVSSSVMKDVNRFCERQKNIPFTVRNVKRMIEIIFQTREETYKKSLIDSIDYFTRYTHKNRYSVPGWKTNQGHLLNKKFIVNYMVEPKFNSKMGLMHNSGYQRLDDLTKSICSVIGKDYDDIGSLQSFFWDNDIKPSKKYKWGFVEFKCYLKGTVHFRFLCEKEWELVNKKYAEAKGQVLPEQI